jgi:8-amino-7-oxononanoate synthase
MPPWQDQLADELHRRREHDLLRVLRPHPSSTRLIRREGAAPLLNFASNDYLALASHPRLIAAARDAVARFGVGAGASRLVVGDLEIHRQVERHFAAFKHAEAALLCPTGYMANLAVVTALAGPGDTLFSDKLNHASLIDAARAAGGGLGSSGATVRVFPHGDLNKLERLLERAADARRRIIVTDSVFSMDGDLADLPTLCDLRDKYDAILIVDEAHGTGVLGERGSGLAEMQGVAGRIDVTVSTASKALGALGGIVTGSQLVIDTLVNTARSFIYTTAMPPAQAAVIGEAIRVVRDEPQRRERLLSLVSRVRGELRAKGWQVTDDPTPIIPLVVGSEAAALEMSKKLENEGILCPAIRPPTVAPETCRLRLTLRCDLEDGDVEKVLGVMGEVGG